MGSRDLSDGTWVWPEGLAHYVERHNVVLPEAFVHTMRAGAWAVPDEAAERVGVWRSRTPEYDFEPWTEWARLYRPWYSFW
jgi:hypothetical protein